MAQLGVLLTRGPMGWPGAPLVPGNSLGGSLRLDRLENSLVGSLRPDRVINSLEGSLYPDKVDNGLEISMTSDKGTIKAARVEHRLPPKQQVGGTRRGVTHAALRGTRRTKATTGRQSKSPRSSPRGKIQLTSKHRRRMRP